MMTLRQIRHFRAVYETGSIQAATERMHISQPALTHSIQKLEQDLGVVLFERSKFGMTPTVFGTNVAQRLGDLLLELDDVARDARLYRNLDTGSICIGAGQAIREPLGRLCIPPFVEENPGIALRLKEGTSPELVAAIQSRELDFVVAGAASYREYPFLHAEPLSRITLEAVVRKDHPLTLSGEEIELSTLLAYPLAGPTALGSKHPFLQTLGEEKHLMTPKYMCSDYAVLQQIVCNTDAWTVVMGGAFSDELPDSLQRLIVPGLDLQIDLGVIELKNRSRAPAAQRFIDSLRNRLAENGKHKG